MVKVKITQNLIYRNSYLNKIRHQESHATILMLGTLILEPFVGLPWPSGGGQPKRQKKQ